MPFCPKRLPQPQNLPISDTFLSQHFIFFDNRRKIKSRKTRFVARPPLSHLRWRFAPLRGTQHRCAGASRHPSGALRAQRAARAPFYEHEKKAGGGGYFVVGKRGPRTSSGGPRTRAMVLAAVAAAAAFLGNDRTALMLRHVPHAPLTTGFIVCFANLNAA